MKTTLIYLAGAGTPFAVWFLICCWGMFTDWRAHRRYQRAWDKFTAEWDAMPFPKQVDFIANRPSHSRVYNDSRSAWFAHRWQSGRTTEV